jgi:hypothetical protein
MSSRFSTLSVLSFNVDYPLINFVISTGCAHKHPAARDISYRALGQLLKTMDKAYIDHELLLEEVTQMTGLVMKQFCASLCQSLYYQPNHLIDF